MRVKYTTIAQVIDENVNTINLPRTSIHDAYALKFTMKYLNDTGAARTPTRENLLEAIQEIVLTSDSSRIHYWVNGLQLAKLNARIHKYQCEPVLFKPTGVIANNAHFEETFVLYLDEGDIVATAHNNLELRVIFKPKTADGIRVVNASCVVTIIEQLCTQTELFAKYGNDLRGVAEPKVTVKKVTAHATTDLYPIIDIPTQTLLRGCILTFSPVIAPEEGEGDGMPASTGILRLVPDRVELENIDWATHRAINEITYQTKFPENMVLWNFGTQWQSNGVGKDGWSFNKHDVEIAARLSRDTNVEYISLESLVDTALYSANVAFTEY